VRSQENLPWEAAVRRLIAAVCLLCMIAPLALYLLFAHGSHQAWLKAEAEILAQIITTEINKSPEFWKYEDIRFAALLRRGLPDADLPVLRQLIDANQKPVASAGVSQAPPATTVIVPVFDAGNVAGYLRISHSILDMLLVSVLVLGVSSCCSALVYYVLHSFPLRVLRSAFAALHKEKEQATITLDTIADMVITTDNALRIRSLNPAAVQLVGIQSPGGIGNLITEYFDITHPRSSERMECLFRLWLQTEPDPGRHREQVVLVRHWDRRKFDVEMTLSQLRDEQGRLLGLVVVFHDITESMALENKLRQRVTELAHIVRHAGVGIAFARGGLVEDINDNTADIIGLPRERIIGTKVTEVLQSCLGYNDPIELIYQRLGQGELFDVEHKMVRPDGKQIWLRLIGKAIDPENLRETGSVWIAQDITQLKQRQLELEAARSHAEEASRFKSQFLAYISHELRSPLSGIIGMNDLMLGTDLTVKQREYLTAMETSTQTLLQLLNDLLDLSKIEAGAMELEKKEFWLTAISSYVHNTLAQKIQEKDLFLEFSIGVDVPPLLIGDELRLGQILLNLIGNAVKFTERGGVRVNCRKTAEKGTAIQLQFMVTDTGCGLTDKEINKIFDTYVQASSSVARTHGGSGLGLSICKKLTTLMGGDIWVESRPGEGSTFFFTAWFERSRQGGEEHAITEVCVAGGGEVESKEAKSILLVEDLPFNQTLAKLLLENDGHNVRVAGDGREALVALTESSFDVVFMDVRMPIMDGLTATRLIRRCETTPRPLAREENDLIRRVAARVRGGHIPIVGMTGDATDNGRQECYAAGMDGVVCKPFDLAGLMEALATYSTTGVLPNTFRFD